MNEFIKLILIKINKSNDIALNEILLV